MLRFFTFFLIMLLPTLCVGMGADHEAGDLPLRWSKDVYQAVNQPNRVHGFWVNSSDVLFFKGSNAELQAMTQKLNQANAPNVQIVLHAGTGIAKSPWSKKNVGSFTWA